MGLSWCPTRWWPESSSCGRWLAKVDYPVRTRSLSSCELLPETRGMPSSLLLRRRKGPAVDVYLLPRRSGAYFLYSNEIRPESTDPPAATDTPVRRALSHARRSYEWLSGRRRRRELLLKSLGQIERVRIHHPSAMSEAQVRSAYGGLIQAAIAKHGKWMIANAAAVPVSVPLSLIPGPNLLLGYLAWRSVIHYQSRKAGQRATELPIDFAPETVLSELTDFLQRRILFRRKRKIRKLGEELGLANLDQAY